MEDNLNPEWDRLIKTFKKSNIRPIDYRVTNHTVATVDDGSSLAELMRKAEGFDPSAIKFDIDGYCTVSLVQTIKLVNANFEVEMGLYKEKLTLFLESEESRSRINAKFAELQHEAGKLFKAISSKLKRYRLSSSITNEMKEDIKVYVKNTTPNLVNVMKKLTLSKGHYEKFSQGAQAKDPLLYKTIFEKYKEEFGGPEITDEAIYKELI
jgi:hypothetical protein